MGVFHIVYTTQGFSGHRYLLKSPPSILRAVFDLSAAGALLCLHTFTGKGQANPLKTQRVQLESSKGTRVPDGKGQNGPPNCSCQDFGGQPRLEKRASLPAGVQTKVLNNADLCAVFPWHSFSISGSKIIAEKWLEGVMLGKMMYGRVWGEREARYECKAYLRYCCRAQDAGASVYFNAAIIQCIDSKQCEPEDNCWKCCSYGKRCLTLGPLLNISPLEL